MYARRLIMCTDEAGRSRKGEDALKYSDSNMRGERGEKRRRHALRQHGDPVHLSEPQDIDVPEIQLCFVAGVISVFAITPWRFHDALPPGSRRRAQDRKEHR